LLLLVLFGIVDVYVVIVVFVGVDFVVVYTMYAPVRVVTLIHYIQLLVIRLLINILYIGTWWHNIRV